MSSVHSHKRVAIIGCGYIGSALGETLVRAGHDVVGTTTTPDRADELRREGIRPEVVQVAGVERLHEILGDREAVYLTIAPRTRGEDYRDVYLAAARAVVTAVDGTAVRRIIYTSSTRVYGVNDGSWVDESTPPTPRDENGHILREVEQVLLGAEKPPRDSADRRVSVVRMSAIYGPERKMEKFIHAAAGTERSDGEGWVNLIHRDDIVMALTALLDVAHHGVLNLSNDRPERRRRLYDRILAEADLPPITWTAADPPTGLGKRIRNDLIERTLGLTLEHPTF